LLGAVGAVVEASRQAEPQRLVEETARALVRQPQEPSTPVAVAEAAVREEVLPEQAVQALWF
jgi:hypothetical protein